MAGWSTRAGVSAAVLGLCLAAAGCGEKDAGGAEAAKVERPAASVEVMTVAAGEKAGEIRASGLIAFKREVALGFGAPGEITNIKYDVGDRIPAGAVIATLRRTTVGADRQESDIVEKTAQLNFDRVTRLNQSGAASNADVEAAKLALERSRTALQLVATSSGVVLTREADQGQVVSAGQPVFRLGETGSGVVARVTAPSLQVSQVKAGDAAVVRVRDGQEFTGVVERLSPVSTSTAGVFEIDVRIRNPEGLRSGEVAEASIASGSTAAPSTRIIVPALALLDARADQGIVFVVDDKGAAHRRAIRTEGVGDEGVIVVDGLKPGDRLITRGASMIRDGDPVRIVSPPDPNQAGK